MRRNVGLGGEAASRRSTDYLGVTLPSEVGSIRGPESVYGGRESIMDGRRSRSSTDALRNPFGRDSTYEGMLDEEEDEEREAMEVDLASWGLDGYIPEDKGKGKQKAKSDTLPNPHDLPLRRPAGLRSEPGRSGMHASRSMSMGNFGDFGEGDAFLDEKSGLSARRHSFGSPLDMQSMERPTHRGRTVSSHALIENLPVTPPLHSIPFPTTETVRSPSPAPTDALSLERPQSRGSESVLNRGRMLSTASFGSQVLLNEEKPNPFAVRLPSPDRTSRFDPKSRARTTSYGSMGTMLTPGLEQEEEANPFALRPPSPSRSSRFDPKVRARTVSMASLGTQALLDYDAHSSDDNRSHVGRTRPYSRLELMRPKVLIMPSPLQSSVSSGPVNGAMQPRAIEGAELHASDAAPLPPGARAARRSSTTLSMIDASGASPSPGLIASNSFTPNPRATLSLSQLTFRNNLVVDGERDPAYADIEGHLRRATADGEQIEPEPEPEPAPPTPAPEIVIDPADRSKRPAGKLYGRSLIDNIETRKAAMKGKSRVFRGDERPSMMARPQVQRSSTLIDPDSLKPRPQSQFLDASRSQPNLSRRNTLVQLDDELPGASRRQLSGNGFETSKKSVFGVDTLWERELAKLRDIEEQERVAVEEETRRQAEEGAKRAKKGKKKRKGKKTEEGRQQEVDSFLAASTSDLALGRSPQPETQSSADPKTPSTPYVLPEIPRATTRKHKQHPPPNDDSDNDDNSDDAPAAHKRSMSQDRAADEWIAGSSDEEDGARRRPRVTSGAGLMDQPTVSMVSLRLAGDDSSDEDVPLVATISRAAQRATVHASYVDDDSDEEKPLSALLDKGKLKLPDLGSTGGKLLPNNSDKIDDDEEDDKPLGLRVSRVINSSQALSSTSQDADDDKPLAFHPEQLRKTQYMSMMAQQQQQMMMQAQAAQFHQSMIFSAPSMMTSGFFAPPMAPQMMMPSALPTTPPPAPDASKYGLVDKWRHDVAVEGEG
ncbi:hypothetical protein DAEQUDRAFT_734624 [Daedalea quercina L-15889]|uniref:Uncharacterized protein n=1 Tax=Daedalea quercina L-15889 TaxID=1314783 RepID=A0A165U1L8_9APHY|nr:hypothetical protein DAEQUDRAFT_734624 [Daedalea quercina L-15889]